PVPPPGPGVPVPFPAPPTERDRRRLWLGLGLGGALLAVCCLGGIFGFGALLVKTSRDVVTEARTVVTDYLEALRQGDYTTAYDDLCAGLHTRISADEFASTQSSAPPIVGYTVLAPTASGTAIVVPATVERIDGSRESPRFTVARDTGATAPLKICGIRQ
ncbi:MAG TPA: hypothetical protein VJT31_31395, partial [Rugosimonospora sp.]|nr:hypothetical protein [Rugosimonospora sp.]